ncbi:MAG: ComEC/Rec2 family competence protein [Candidatus Melainabacteria bacterium]|nr:ComEC/Rec2 family competence protein [Candidatus Melainabacteria bacterium]
MASPVLRFRKKSILLLIFSVLFGYFYTFFYFKCLTINLDNFLNQKNIYIGEILSSSKESGSFYKKYYLKLKKITGSSDYQIKGLKKCNVQVLGSKYEEYAPGDLIQVTGILKRPKSAALPGLFDERKYLLSQDIHYILKAERGTLVFLGMPTETIFNRHINELRNKLISINKKGLPFDNSALINGIVFGSKASKLKGELKDKIQNLGLSHITAASGFNVSILACGIFYLFRLFSKRNLFPSIVSIFVVLTYSAIADFSASVLRATIFIVLVLAGNLFDKKLKILPGISLIVLLFFLFNPANMLDAGLQLSILAFLGLVLFSNEAQNLISPFISKRIEWLLSIFLQSLFAQIMTIPLIVFYFHNVQILGIVSNLIAVPLASMILISGLVSILFTVFGHFEYLISPILKFLSDLFLLWVNYLSKIQVQQIFIPNLNFYFLILIYGLIVYILSFFFIPSLRKKSWIVLLLIGFLFLMIYKVTDTSKYLKIFCIPRYNQELTLVMPPHERPFCFATNINKSSIEDIKEFLKLNNISLRPFVYDLSKSNSFVLPSAFIQNDRNKLTIKVKDFSFEIIKNYTREISSTANCVELPILRKSDPILSSVLKILPELLIINDYKRLSKKSIKDIKWLKSKETKSLFLSETGTITLVADGKKYKVLFSEY